MSGQVHAEHEDGGEFFAHVQNKTILFALARALNASEEFDEVKVEVEESVMTDEWLPGSED